MEGITYNIRHEHGKFYIDTVEGAAVIESKDIVNYVNLATIDKSEY